MMKFLGSCYNYKVLHTDTLFSLMYKMINLDIDGQSDNRLLELDRPNDCFRVSLVCSLLDSLGKNLFSKLKRRLLLDRFLIFFQKYIFEKDYILMEVEF